MAVLEMFEDEDFNGQRIDTDASISDFRTVGFNDKLTSFRINGAPGEYKVEFYLNVNYDTKWFTEKSPCICRRLRDNQGGFVGNNDRISSVKIIKVASL